MQTVYLTNTINERASLVMSLITNADVHVETINVEQNLDTLQPNGIIAISSSDVRDIGGHDRFLQIVKQSKIYKIVEIDFGSDTFQVEKKLAGRHIAIRLPSQADNDQITSSIISDYLTEHTFGYTFGDEVSTKLLRLSKRIAAKNVTVLINGPSGSGKELLARFIHHNSNRKDESFVAINCAAIPENMLEAVLFGHEKGSFTGASTSNAGMFRAAHGGTILLDEISEMPLALQAKILRVIQEKSVVPLGSSKEIEVDVRIIATTNRDMQEQVRQGDFREDLYYRLNVFPVFKAPLKDRPGDIIPIATKLIRKHSTDLEHDFILTEEAAKLLIQHDWPGNVRELENVIQRALVLTDTSNLDDASILISPEISKTAFDVIADRQLQVAG